MQTIPNEFITAIKRGYEIPLRTQVVAEWNYNYFTKTTVFNDQAPEVKWLENDLYFPVNSITNGIRPKSGIFYAFTNNSYTVGPYDNGIPAERYYTVAQDNNYKYFVSPERSGEHNENFYDNSLQPEFIIKNCIPVVRYDNDVKINKVRITFNVGALPTDWSIHLVHNGIDTVVIDSPMVDPSTGVCEVWFNGTDWTETQNIDPDNFVIIDALKINIRKIDKANTRMQIIELAAIREIDLTDRTISYDFDMSMDEEDFIRPVGTISSNSGSINLSNYELDIKYDNSGDFGGLLNVWAQFRMYLKADLSYWGGSNDAIVRLATMYTNEWRQNNESEYQIELFDIIKVLQQVKCSPMLVENQTFAAIASRILDMVGCDTYNFNSRYFDSSALIKYFWTDGDETVYDVLKRLCESSMSVLFVDEFGIIQYMSRDQIANNTDLPVWNFLAENVGNDIADIISIKKNYENIANNVTVKYTKREAKIDALDITQQPLTSQVWGADDTIVLRAAPLRRGVPKAFNDDIPLDGGFDLWVTPEEAESWPYKGKVNVEGEIFQLNGRGYFTWNYTTNVRTEVVARSDEDKRKFDLETFKTHPQYGSGALVDTDPTKQNGWSGRLRVVKRMVDNSVSSPHSEAVGEGWKMMDLYLRETPNGHFFDWGGLYGGTGDWKNRSPWYSTQNRWSNVGSVLTCNNNNSPNDRHLAVALRKFDGNNFMREYGTRVKFKQGGGSAGIVFNISDKDTYDETDLGPDNIINAKRCYMLNVLSTETADKLGRGWTDEVFLEVKINDTWFALPTIRDPKSTRGAKWTIDPDKWYDIELVFNDYMVLNSPGPYSGPSGSSIEVFIDGQYVDTFFSETRIHPTPWAGIFARGSCTVDFDYFYATNTVQPDYSAFNDDLFTSYTVQLPAGTNRVEVLGIPRQNMWNGDIVVSFASQALVTLNSVKAIEDTLPNNPSLFVYRMGMEYIGPQLNPQYIKSRNYGKVVIPANARVPFELKYSNINATGMVLDYTASETVSVCIETSLVPGFEYGDAYYNVPNDNSIWDITKGGYVSNKLHNGLLKWIPNENNSYDSLGNLYSRALFFDEFGAIIHEIKEFDVELDIAPVKSPRVFLDNEKCKVLDQKYHPVKGQFTLVNTSRQNEIINGSEQLSESESIDHTLMMYGYVLEDKGEQEKTVKNEISMLKRGEIKLDIEAEWIFSDEEAESLANWIVSHWAEPMQTLSIEAFTNCHSQVGDKVTLTYTNLGITNSMLFIVSSIKRGFDDSGFTSSLTLRRVK